MSPIPPPSVLVTYFRCGPFQNTTEATFSSSDATTVNSTLTTVQRLVLTSEPHAHAHTIGGVPSRIAVPLLALLGLLFIFILYLRYKISKKAYFYMMPLYKPYFSEERGDADEEDSGSGHEMRDLSELPSYSQVRPPPEYRVALTMPRPDRHTHRRTDQYALVSEQNL